MLRVGEHESRARGERKARGSSYEQVNAQRVAVVEVAVGAQRKRCEGEILVRDSTDTGALRLFRSSLQLSLFYTEQASPPCTCMCIYICSD